MRVRYLVEVFRSGRQRLPLADLSAHRLAGEVAVSVDPDSFFLPDREVALTLSRRLRRAHRRWKVKIFEVPDPNGDWGEAFLFFATMEDRVFCPALDGETLVLPGAPNASRSSPRLYPSEELLANVPSRARRRVPLRAALVRRRVSAV
jgi:hypothetical protein